MDDSARSVLAAVARRHGRELSALAYLILQNRSASEQAAAAGLADARRSLTTKGEGEPRWPVMVGAVLRRALEARPSVHEIDAPGESAPLVLGLLSPLQQAAAGGHLLAGVSLEELAASFEVPPAGLRRELMNAEDVAGNRERLRRALGAFLTGRAFAVTAEQVEAAQRLRPPRRVARHRRLPWFVGGAAAAVLLVGTLLAAGEPPAGSAQTSTPSPTAAGIALGYPPGGPRGAGAWRAGPTLHLDDRLTLADCDIQPASTPVAFRGWLTLGDLSASGRDAPGAGTPVYALVTDGPAEWIGWQTAEGRPMFPRPVGRMACAVSPLTSTATVFSVSDHWKPPAPMDGCPASPILRYAGDHQIGGPSAFVLLPFDGEAWWARTSIVLRVRVAPRPAAGARISAEAQLLDGFGSMSLPVDSPPIADTTPPTSNLYFWLRPVRFPTDGCWLVSIKVDGVSVGAAILPITAPAG